MASATPTASPGPLEVTGKYLMAFRGCDTAVSPNCMDPRYHKVYLAQSDDGAQWAIVPGWNAYQGSVPEVIRRGDTIYVYTPGRLRRYHLDTGAVDGPLAVDVPGAEGFVDPSVIVDDQGRLTLFFLYGRSGDPAGCPRGTTSCVNRFGSATEVQASDGASFTLDEGDRATIALSASGSIHSASDPDVFFDGKQYVMYAAFGPSISVWTSPALRGSYTQLATLPGGLLNDNTGSVASGYFDQSSRRYWTYADAPQPGQTTVIVRAVHADLARQLSESDWAVLFSGASIGLTATTEVGSPGFAVNAP